MILKIVYHNPNVNGSNVHLIDDVVYYATRNRELHIWREGSNHEKDLPDIGFSVGQWICFERQLNEEQSQQTVPARSRREPTAADSRAVDVRTRPGNNGRRRPSDLRDLTYPSAESAEQNRQAMTEFAVDNLVVPWSDAHMRALLEYEKAVEDEHGSEAVKELPWNKVPRGTDPNPPLRRR